MLIEWSESALADLREIVDYISERNYLAALDLQDRIEESVEHLAEHPRDRCHGVPQKLSTLYLI